MTKQNHTNSSFISEVFRYLKTQKRWWLTPIILALCFLAVVALLAGLAPALPFLYTLF
jgi:fluoride ion exporter CrcB/FEX